MTLKTMKINSVPKPIRLHVSSVGEELKRRTDRPELSLNRLPGLDRRIHGLQSKELIICGARTSQGKTTLVLNMAWDLAMQGHRVLLLSLEMTVSSMVERLFCLSQRVNNFDLLTGRFSSHLNKWEQFSKDCEQASLVLTEGIGKTWEEIDYLISNFDPPPKVVIIDYIQMIRGNHKLRKEAIDDYILHLRQMAIEKEFCAILCSQINRAAQNSEDKEPQLHNLKETGCLEECADKVLLLHYPAFYDESQPRNKYVLNLAKNRSGRTGSVEINFYPEFYLFEDYAVPVSKYPENKEIQTVKELFGGNVVKVNSWDD